MKRSHKYLIFITLILVVVSSGLFVVDQRQQALVVQFGQIVKAINTPGLNIKIPFIQNTIFFDKRILDLSIEEQEVIAADQKRLIIDAYAKYKIIDPVKFYTTVNNLLNAENKLNAILDSSLRRIVGEIPLITLLGESRSEVMSRIKGAVSKETVIFGLEIVDVRIVRGDLPKENSEAIFRRMQTEREKEAREIRAEGAEAADRIRAEADKQRTIILAEAKKEANIIRGNGDGKASKIFANAFNKDPEFFNFYRSMQAYNKSLTKEKTTMILTPEGEFFKFFGDKK